MISNIKFLIFFILIFSYSNIFSQEILNQKINIPKNDYKIGDLLKKIEQNNDVKFSFNSEIIDVENTISFYCENIKLIDCLNQIFENKLRYQVSGKYIILLKKTLPEEKKNIKQKITIFGTVINLENNKLLPEVSVYDLDKNYSTVSNHNGEFNFTINSNQQFRGLTIGKQGFYDTVIILNSNNIDKINIGLRPKEIKIENYKPFYDSIQAIKPLINYDLGIEKVQTTEIFIPKSTISNSKNLDFIDNTRFAQISFLPGLSSNLSNFGVVKNHISINVLIGYSKGVNGFELASLMNFDKNEVQGIQIAGLTNVVGGKVTGLQAAGLFNIDLKNVNATQIAGIANVVHGNTIGLQTSGIFNTNIGKLDGSQIAGIANTTTKQFTGLQLAGIINLNTSTTNGIQTAGIVNFNYKKIKGAQIAGILNMALDTVAGVQISGIMNVAKISKYQITPLFNVAKENKGVQIALLNFCDTSSGVSIGLVSFVRKGYKNLIFSTNEIYSTNLNIHLGTTKFYNIYSISYQKSDKIIWGAGYGFGHKFILTKKIKLDLEFTRNFLNYNTVFNSKFFRFNKISPIFEFSIYKKFKIYAAPSLNFYSNTKIGNIETHNFISQHTILLLSQNQTTKYLYKSWLGFTVGVSL